MRGDRVPSRAAGVAAVGLGDVRVGNRAVGFVDDADVASLGDGDGVGIWPIAKVCCGVRVFFVLAAAVPLSFLPVLVYLFAFLFACALSSFLLPVPYLFAFACALSLSFACALSLSFAFALSLPFCLCSSLSFA